MARVPAGTATLGAKVGEIPFGWDNEFPGQVVEVAAFDIDEHDVTNENFLEFVESGGYTREDLWSPQAWKRQVSAGREHPLFWNVEMAAGSGLACSSASISRWPGQCS